MQLIRTINNNNKNNNNKSNTNKNNNQSSNVAITGSSATPANVKTSFSQQQQHITQPSLGQKQSSLFANQPNASAGNNSPASPSVSLPPLKKRTAVVKQSVPPPVPPRGSPRSKSKSNRYDKPTFSASIIAPKQLDKLNRLEPSGSQKVKEWLETVRDGSFEHDDDEDFKLKPSVSSQPRKVSSNVEISKTHSDETFKFKSVKSIIENFSKLEICSPKKSRSFSTRDKVYDSNIVRSRIENFNSLERGRNRNFDKQKIFSNTMRSEAGTDSGIDITRDVNLRKLDILQKLGGHCDGFGNNNEFANENIARLMNQFSLEGEFV